MPSSSSPTFAPGPRIPPIALATSASVDVPDVLLLMRPPSLRRGHARAPAPRPGAAGAGPRAPTSRCTRGRPGAARRRQRQTDGPHLAGRDRPRGRARAHVDEPAVGGGEIVEEKVDALRPRRRVDRERRPQGMVDAVALEEAEARPGRDVERDVSAVHEHDLDRRLAARPGLDGDAGRVAPRTDMRLDLDGDRMLAPADQRDAAIAPGRRRRGEPERGVRGGDVSARERPHGEPGSFDPLEDRARLPAPPVRIRNGLDQGGEPARRPAEDDLAHRPTSISFPVMFPTVPGGTCSIVTWPQCSHGFGWYGSVITCASPQRRAQKSS